MAACRLDDRDARVDERLAEVLSRADAVAQVVVVDALAQALRDRLEVPAGVVDIDYVQDGPKVTSVRIRNVASYLAVEGVHAAGGFGGSRHCFLPPLLLIFL